MPGLFPYTNHYVFEPRIGGAALLREAGPTKDYACVTFHGSGGGYVQYGAWKNQGGDFIDRNGTPQGTVPWHTQALNVASTGEATYTADITAVVKHLQQQKMPLALLLKRSGPASRTLCGRFDANGTPTNPKRPKLIVTYASGDTVTLDVLITAAINSGSVPRTVQTTMAFPVMVEFQALRADDEVVTAAAVVTINQFSGLANLDVYAINADRSLSPVETGVAAGAPLDAGLIDEPSVLGYHRYLDGLPESEFLVLQPGPSGMPAWNTAAEKDFCPAIYGTGPEDLTKLPHIAQVARGSHIAGAKWINAKHSGNGTLVPSTHTEPGFKPFAPGVGAMRFEIPREVTADGQIVGYDGTGGGHAKLYLPEPIYARDGRYFIRYAVLMVRPPEIDTEPPGGYQVYQSATGQPVFTNALGNAGKFCVTWEHETPDGGVSGSAGGGHGWQWRNGWREFDYEGPDKGGVVIYKHLHDFQRNAPVGHKYGAGDPVKGGKCPRLFGSTLYYGAWYTIEEELLPNTLLPTDPGYLADGVARIWLNDRLIYEATELVIRSKPLDPRAYNPNSMRPIREIGTRACWWNYFHGGTSANAKTRVAYVTALAWGTQRLGAMRIS